MSTVTVDRSTACKWKGDDSVDIEGTGFPHLKPIVITHRPALRIKISCTNQEQKNEVLQDIVEVTVENKLLVKGDQDGCETPKSKEHKIPKVLECPPAPMKQKPKRKIASLPEGFFFVPQDSDSALLLYIMSPPRKKLQWSKRTSPLAVEQNADDHL